MVDDKSAPDTNSGTVPPEMTTYYLGLLRKGPNWKPGESEEILKLQENHLAHIRWMAEKGQLVIAGPFTDGGDLRGVFLFKTRTLEEAQALASSDPAVIAGRLEIDIHPWMVPAGILP